MTAAWRVIFSLLIAYTFTIALMTAAAQQHIASALTELDTPVDYSSAYPTTLEVPDLRREVDRAREAAAAARAARVEMETLRDEINIDANSAWSRFVQVAVQLPEEGCGGVDFNAQDSVWQWARQCLAAGDVPPKQRGPLSEILSQQPHALDLMADIGRYAREADRLAAIELSANETHTAAQVNLARGMEMKLIFDEMDALSTPWLPGAAAFKKFPPVLMNIILALVSGAFGALLVTLIIYVYPTNAFSFATGKGFEPRVMLGGAISIGVYIILSGGASVLGAAPSLDDSTTNVMTFCAVGVLAGMFSDRVAFWLSDRAEMFFARDRTTDAGKPPLDS